MIPTIALMIAIYGSARLLNDGFKRHPGNVAFTVLTWIVSAIAILILLVLAFAVNHQAASIPNM